MKMKKGDGELEQRMQDDLWKYRIKYFHGEDADEYWIDLCDEADAITRKYNNNIYVQMMLCVCVEDIESRYYAAQGQPVDSYLKLERAMKLYDIFVKRRKENGQA